jgi:hypothetical protein
MSGSGRLGERKVVQLELFEGEHLPLFRARAAMAEGDLRGAHQALESARDGLGAAWVAEQLERLEGLLLRCEDSLPRAPEAVHAAFEETFRAGAEPRRDPIGASGWFHLYAARLAEALGTTPARRFRGWCSMHFALAAGRTAEALAGAERIVSESAGAWAWLEASRVAHASGRATDGNRWAVVACLTSREALDPAPPPLLPTGRSELDAPEGVLPDLPRALGDLWTEALLLDLPEPACAWVPALGALDGVFATPTLRSPDLVQATSFDLAGPVPPDEPAPRAFLRALVAAREARALETRQAGGCGELELRARAAMKRAAPALFRRYLAALGLYA